MPNINRLTCGLLVCGLIACVRPLPNSGPQALRSPCKAGLEVQLQMATGSDSQEPWINVVAGAKMEEGKGFRVKVCVSQRVHLYALHRDTAGAIRNLLPAHGDVALVDAGVHASALAELHGASGQESITVVASRRALSAELLQRAVTTAMPVSKTNDACAQVREPEPDKDPPDTKPDDYQCVSEFSEDGERAVVSFTFQHQ